jgi:putative SOS response-associated peptidase YedK
MPVIMMREKYDLWLDPGFEKTDDLLDLLKPFPADATPASCEHSREFGEERRSRLR